jgi:hypothetical protein
MIDTVDMMASVVAGVTMSLGGLGTVAEQRCSL